MSEKEQKAEEIKKEQVEEKKGEQGPRRGQGNQKRRGGAKVQYYEKGSRPQNEEVEEDWGKREKQPFIKNKKPRMVRKPNAPYVQHERINITLETKIPEKPKKEQLIKPMDDNEYQTKYKELSAEIDTLWSNFHKLNSTVHNPAINQPDATLLQNLKEARKQKSDMKNAAYDAWSKVHAQFLVLKNDVEKSFDTSQKFRQKMKVLMSKEEIENKIKELQDVLYNEQNSVQQEKQLIKEIEDLERSLPFANPLENLNKQFEDKKEQRKRVGNEMHQLWEVYSKAKEDWKLINDQFQDQIQTKQTIQGDKHKVNEEMQDKRKEVQIQEENVIQKIKELNEKYKKQWNDYYEQQQQIKDIDFMAKLQLKLKRNEERRKREEKEMKDKEEEDKMVKENPYKEELELVTLLISYCIKLAPQKKEEEAGKPQEEQKDVQQLINKGDWKKENVTIMKSKKDIENDFFIGNKKKKQRKAPANKPQNPEKPEQQALNHKLDVIGYFDKLKVLAPLWANQLENTIKQLEEKKEYFLKFQDGTIPEEKKEEVEKKEEQEEEEEKEEEKVQTEEGKQAKKQDKKKEQKKKAEVLEFKEEDFPTM
eukprot:TRINITY_DN2348_c0_g2_i2.p1 TRINITY_DN2348_c0_g2~~TRINITY_DN2348_c0_g2_i2.p1  ORF type:complete len:592 (-),score=164.99 TRINITY_DN2348_c0_g2_i2:102-1877(-)